MATTVTVTNLTSSALLVSDIYTELGPTGATNASATFTRSVSDLDRMGGLQALIAAGTVSVSIAESTGNVQMLSIPLEMHANVPTLAVDAVAVVTHAVTFPTPYPTGVVPQIFVSMQRNTHTDWKAQVYAQAITATGFTIALDVTVASGTSGEKGNVNWRSTY